MAVAFATRKLFPRLTLVEPWERWPRQVRPTPFHVLGYGLAGEVGT